MFRASSDRSIMSSKHNLRYSCYFLKEKTRNDRSYEFWSSEEKKNEDS